MTLKELRLQSKKTPAEMANALSVSLQTAYRYEQGTRRISIEQVLILAELYDCTAEEVITAQLNSCQFARLGSRL